MYVAQTQTSKRHYSNTPQSDEIALRMLEWSVDTHDYSDHRGIAALSSDIAEMIAAGEWDSSLYRQSIGRGNLAGYIASIRHNYFES